MQETTTRTMTLSEYADEFGIPARPTYGGYKLRREHVAAILLGQKPEIRGGERVQAAHVYYAMFPASPGTHDDHPHPSA